MSESSGKQPLVFMHTQRCAGSTLTNFLDTHFRNSEILKANLLHKEGDHIEGVAGHTGTPVSLRDISTYKLIAGHNNFGNLEEIVPNAMYITMLREPVDRVVSLYTYWRSHTEEYTEQHDLRGPRLARQLSLHDFVQCELPEAQYNVNNGQARQFLHGLGGPIELSAEDFLCLAKEKLARFALAGITEMFDLSVTLLCCLLGWNLPHEIESANRFEQNLLQTDQFQAIDREPVSADTLAQIARRNRVDMELYRFGLKRFQEKCDTALRELAARRPAPESARPLFLKRAARRLRLMLDNYVHPQ